MSSQTESSGLDSLGRIMLTPVAFGVGLGGIDFAPHQIRALDAIMSHRKTAFVKCNSSGFTFALGQLAVWWFARYEDGVVLTTSATGKQVEGQLWKEIRNAMRLSGIRFPEPNLTSVRMVDPVTQRERLMVGVSTNDPHALRGWRGRHVLLVIDEATQIPDDQWLAIDMAPAGGDVRIVAVSNATNPMSKFAAIVKGQIPGWHTGRVSCWDTPNLAGLDLGALVAMPTDEGGPLDDNPWPQLTTRRWVRELWDDPTVSEWQFRMLAEAVFPEQSPYAAIPWTWIERADRPHAAATSQIRIGVDVAGGGDNETAVVAASAGAILAVEGFTSRDARGDVAAFCERWRSNDPLLVVDNVGIGHYFVEHLKSLGFRVHGENGGLPAMDTSRFFDRRAEMVTATRELFEADGVSGLTDERLKAQTAGIEFAPPDPRGRTRLAKKPTPSPDRFDALIYAVAGAVGRKAVEVEGGGIYLSDRQSDRDGNTEWRGVASVAHEDF